MYIFVDYYAVELSLLQFSGSISCFPRRQSQINKHKVCLNCSQYINCIGTNSIFKTKHYLRTDCSWITHLLKLYLLIYFKFVKFNLLCLDKLHFLFFVLFWVFLCVCVPVTYLNYYFQCWVSFRIHTSRVDYKSTMNPFFKWTESYWKRTVLLFQTVSNHIILIYPLGRKSWKQVKWMKI